MAQSQQNLAATYSTDDQYSQYILDQLAPITNANTALYYIYYALLVVVIYILFFVKKEYAMYSRFFILILLILFPVLLGFIENFLYNVVAYLYAFMAGYTYTGPSIIPQNLSINYYTFSPLVSWVNNLTGNGLNSNN